MSDPSYLLQVAIVAALKADAALAVLLGTGNGMRVYDDVPDDTAFPYINVGEGQVLGDDTEDCGDGSEVFLRTHCWSREPGFPEVKKIAAEVRRILKSAPTLTGFAVPLVEFVQTQFLRDPDGLTRHAVVEHRYLITHTS